MLGGFNVKPLVELLDDAQVGAIAADALKNTLLVFDAFNDVKRLADAGNANAKAVIQSWAEAEWFTERPEVPASLTVTVFKVTGETNTDDLSPAPDAWSRPDIPLHALAMLKNPRPGVEPDEAGQARPARSSCRSWRPRATRSPTSATWSAPAHRASRRPTRCCGSPAQDIPFVPNKRFGGVCLGGKIAPIFYNTMEDAGALPIELDVSRMEMGDVIELRPYEGKALRRTARSSPSSR